MLNKRDLQMLLAVLATTFASFAIADEDSLRKSASWDWPDVSVYEQHLVSYLDLVQADEQARKQIDEYWSESIEARRGPQFLARLLGVGALLDERIDSVSKQLANPSDVPVHTGDLDWLTSDVPGWMQDTVRLACGRAFAQRRMYDEALEVLAGLELVQVCDPASLLFYRATCEHHLLQPEKCIENVELLLERKEDLPARFSQVAQLMKADIQNLKQDSLDEVSRLMRDVERRLDLGRAGTRVRKEEKDIVEKLDKLIDQIEKQMQQQQQQQQSSQQESNGQPQQSQAMDESQVAGGSGPGDVDEAKTGDRAGWGNLPPAQRQKAMQKLTKDLPSHYRDIIDGYFRQIAKDKP